MLMEISKSNLIPELILIAGSIPILKPIMEPIPEPIQISDPIPIRRSWKRIPDVPKIRR